MWRGGGGQDRVGAPVVQHRKAGTVVVEVLKGVLKAGCYMTLHVHQEQRLQRALSASWGWGRDGALRWALMRLGNHEQQPLPAWQQVPADRDMSGTTGR